MTTIEEADAIQLLITDHRRVEGLFTGIEASPAAGPRRDELIKDIVRELSVHAAIEEQVFYPALRTELPDGDALAEHAIEEHQEVKEILAELDGGTDEARTGALLQRLIATVRDHVREEEAQMFTQLRSAVSQQELSKLGATMAAAKKTAPSRPHPHAPNTPPGNVVAGAAAGLVDRARDALRRD